MQEPAIKGSWKNMDPRGRYEVRPINRSTVLNFTDPMSFLYLYSNLECVKKIQYPEEIKHFQYIHQRISYKHNK